MCLSISKTLSVCARVLIPTNWGGRISPTKKCTHWGRSSGANERIVSERNGILPAAYAQWDVVWGYVATQHIYTTTVTHHSDCLSACQNNTTADKPPSAPLDRVIRDGQVSKRSQSLRILSCSSRINAILVSHWCRASSSSCLRGQERNNWQLFKDFLPGVPPPPFVQYQEVRVWVPHSIPHLPNATGEYFYTHQPIQFASLERLGWNLRQVPELLSTTRNGKLFCLPVWTLAHTPPVIDLHVYFALVSCTLHIISHAAQVLVTILLLFSSSFWCCSCSAPFIHTSVTCLGAGQVKLNGGFWENRLR